MRFRPGWLSISVAVLGCIPASLQQESGDTPGGTTGSSSGSSSGATAESTSGGGTGGTTTSTTGGNVDPDSLRARVSTALPYIGAAVDLTALRAEARYREVLAKEFNAVTPENVMKWEVVHPSADTWDFTGADELVAFAEAQGQAIRGHTLVWHLQAPAYLSSLTPEQLALALQQHIDTVVTRYRGRVRFWDVVNEAAADGGGYRASFLSSALGPAYIRQAFERARAADPEAVLTYNDYGIEVPNVKSDFVYGMLAELKGAGVPVDAVGFQFHVASYDFASPGLDVASLRANIQRFAALGLKVYFTELDVRATELPGMSSEQLAYQAEVYRAVTDVCRSEPGCEGVTLWGFTDKHSWVGAYFGADVPLIYDEQYQRKPAYFSLREGLEGGTGPALTYSLQTDCVGTLGGTAACAGFENTRLTLSDWYAATTSGTLALSTTRRHRGERALHARISPSPSSQALVGKNAFRRVLSGSIYLRAMVYLPSTAPYSTVTFMGVNEPHPPYRGVSVSLVSGGIVQLGFTTADVYLAATQPLAKDAWSCVVLEVTASASAGAATVRVNGVSMVSRSGVNALPPGGYVSASVGILYAAPNHPATELFVDEFVASTSPLSCN